MIANEKMRIAGRSALTREQLASYRVWLAELDAEAHEQGALKYCDRGKRAAVYAALLGGRAAGGEDHCKM